MTAELSPQPDNLDSLPTDRDLTGQYLAEIGRFPLLDAEQEVELSKTIEAGMMAGQLLEEGRIGRAKGGAPKSANREELEWLVEEGENAKQQFINSNLRLVVSIAKKHGRGAMPLLDLIQEGNTGLIKAVEKFDYKKGYKFSTYAVWWIRQGVTRGVAHQSRVIRLPVGVEEQWNSMGRFKRDYQREFGEEPSVEEQASALDVTTERIGELTMWGHDHISLNTPVDETGETELGDLVATETIPGPEDEAVEGMQYVLLHGLVELLEPREADIIQSRFGLVGGTRQKPDDIGRRHNISGERVRQLERAALARLRRLAIQEALGYA